MGKTVTTMAKGRGLLFKQDGFSFMVFATKQTNFWPNTWPQVETGIYAQRAQWVFSNYHLLNSSLFKAGCI